MYLCPGRPLGNQGLCLYIVSPVVCVLVCSSHALKWELYVQDRKCMHPFCVYKALPHPHGVLHRGGGCYSFIICLFSSLHVPSLTPSCIISHSGLLSLHLMAFLFSFTAALWQWSDVLWRVCKSNSPFVPCFLFIPQPKRDSWSAALPFQTARLLHVL